MLDNMMLVYGAGPSDGNRRLHEDQPTLVIGNAAGSIQTGRRLAYPKETPQCNLHLAMMDRMGVHVGHFGDGAGN
jgi:hypothetical protein